jgi:CRISPR-associated protein Csd1
LGRGLNATIRDRFYGAASATPASVFPILIRNANHHLAALRKSGKGGLAFTLEREMGGILDGLGATFPGNLRLEDQGRFAIGYYHERFSRASALPEPAVDNNDTPAEEA